MPYCTENRLISFTTGCAQLIIIITIFNLGSVVRSLGSGDGFTCSTRQRGVSIMGEFMPTIHGTWVFHTNRATRLSDKNLCP